MPDVTFDQLLRIYRRTTFDADGDEGTLLIDSSEVRDDVRSIDADEAVGRATGIDVLSDPAEIVVGGRARLRVGPPKPVLGILARDMDGLLAYPPNRLDEPSAFYVVDGGFDGSTSPTPAPLERYREVLKLVATLGEAAAFLDPTRRELMFVKDGRLPVPVRYDAATLDGLSMADAVALRTMMAEDTHRDQKLAILAEAVATMVSPYPPERRFRLVVENLGELLGKVRDGYRLFASTFSFEKIRSDVEDARLEYLNKIHKTFVDVQGQLLGLPVATVVVASQYKIARSCGLELWTDVAVLGGAWVFATLLLVAVGNQLATLGTIAAEIARQKRKMASDYAAISERFESVFNGLDRRIRWHRRGMWAVCVVALLGAGFATFAYRQLVDVGALACATTRSPPGNAATPASGVEPPVAVDQRGGAGPTVGTDATRSVSVGR